MSIFKSKLEQKVDEIALKLEKIKIDSYVELMSDTTKLIKKNFVAGLSKGIGMAIGFTILGAIALVLLRKIVAMNIPVIGRFVADIAQIVEVNINN
ncbi:MAG: hypothetical protein IKK43_04025 [Clostridia bacterium]|nr:hypothetical protein [Clostridia bacterium]